ncbi:MAG: hypothetical protein KJZ53_01085 [Anaerolineales bacterium]|nr:hypothetical protein [Anaerolineales bacterium]
MEMIDGILKFGRFDNESPFPGVLLTIAQGCYVYSRITLQRKTMLSYYPVSFMLMHHSIESFIKFFLMREGKKFGPIHKLRELLLLGGEEKRLSFFKNEILSSLELMDLLDQFSNNYADNKYGKTSFAIKQLSLIRVYDKLIYIFIKNFKELYPHVSMKFYVSETLLEDFLKDLDYDLSIVVLPEDFS